MADFCACHEIVTEFLLNTCELHHRLNQDTARAVCHCATLATQRRSLDGVETDIVPTTTGSVAEFYIQPMLSSVGDIDVMFHYSGQLAIPAGTHPPTQLPGEFCFHHTVDRVVCNGCDVVRVAHRRCRQDEWMRTRQHRLSFSRAEIVLLNSWIPVQQIVYHLLRVFVKTEGLTDSADNSDATTLSNYHIKTLMLWACELKPRWWWIDDLNLVRLSVELLRILSGWLTNARCRHYFIQNCNLFDHRDCSQRLIANRLIPETEASLAQWFTKNYTRKCAQLWSDSVLRLFDDISNNRTELQKAISAVVDWRLNSLWWETFVCFLHTTSMCDYE